ncbi:SEC14-like protein 2 [Trichonephila clavipes]|nr:SEC14-like protein 2 [Trichonephila clavipes]
MTLADCRRPLFACRMIYRSSPAVVVLGRPPPTFLTAVPVVWNAFQARETTLVDSELCSYTGDDGWQEELLKDIDADVLPAFLGGNRTDSDGNPMCPSFIVHGQIIPEKYYLRNSEKRLFNSPDAKKITVTRFSKHELTFEVKEAKDCYLEWEFETINKDIEFSIHFKDKSSENSKKESIELVPKQRINTHYEPEKGLLRCEKTGTCKYV